MQKGVRIFVGGEDVVPAIAIQLAIAALLRQLLLFSSHFWESLLR
jgi:hypothetical protein